MKLGDNYLDNYRYGAGAGDISTQGFDAALLLGGALCEDGNVLPRPGKIQLILP